MGIVDLPIFASCSELSGPTLRFEAIPMYEMMEEETVTRSDKWWITRGGNTSGVPRATNDVVCPRSIVP